MGPAGLEQATDERSTRVAPRPHRRSAPHSAPRPARGDQLLAVAVAGLPTVAVVLFGAVEPEHGLPLEAAALLLGAWAVATRTRRGDRPLPYPAITLPVLLLAAIPALQLLPLPGGLPALLSPGLARFAGRGARIISADPTATWLALFRWLAYAAFLIGALETLRRPGAATIALAVVTALGVAEAVYGVGSLLAGGRSVLWVARDTASPDATGTLINRNHYAALFELCLPALLARRALDGGTRTSDALGRDAFVLAAAATMGLATLLSHSRAGTLCVGAGLAAGSVLSSRTGTPGTRRMTLAIAGVALVYGAWLGLGPLLARFASLPVEGTADRTGLWRDAVGMLRSFPVAGTGAGAFEAVFPAFRRRTIAQVGWAHAHQDLLELWIEGGVAAVVLALAAARGALRRLRAVLAGPRRAERAAAAALAGGIAAILLHAQVDFPLHIPGLTFLLLLVAAAALSLGPVTPPGASAPARRA